MAEKEYVESEAFVEYWNKEFRHLYPNDKYLVAIANFPTADVVEVVRCRDCIHHTDDIISDFVIWCEKHGIAQFRDHYCSDGKGDTE